jgi:hypothetical protein
VDGQLDVESGPNRGTTLFMNIPLGQRPLEQRNAAQ